MVLLTYGHCSATYLHLPFQLFKYDPFTSLRYNSNCPSFKFKFFRCLAGIILLIYRCISITYICFLGNLRTRHECRIFCTTDWLDMKTHSNSVHLLQSIIQSYHPYLTFSAPWFIYFSQRKKKRKVKRIQHVTSLRLLSYSPPLPLNSDMYNTLVFYLSISNRTRKSKNPSYGASNHYEISLSLPTILSYAVAIPHLVRIYTQYVYNFRKAYFLMIFCTTHNFLFFFFKTSIPTICSYSHAVGTTFLTSPSTPAPLPPPTFPYFVLYKLTFSYTRVVPQSTFFLSQSSFLHVVFLSKSK